MLAHATFPGVCDTRGVRRGLVVSCVLVAVAPLLAACSGEGGDLDAFCATARRFTVDNPAAAFTLLDAADPAGTAAALEAAGQQLRDWAAEAPREVRDDVEALAAAAEDLAVSFAEPGRSSTDEQVVVDEAAVEEASGRVLAFTNERCEVDLDPGTTVPG